MTDKKLEEIRQAFAEYKRTEGCSCCQDIEGHKEAERKLGKLLNAEPYSDNSGFAWHNYIAES